MNRRSSVGAMHPVLFMLTIYAISVVLAFFVCNVVYKSMHQSSPLTDKNLSNMETLTALK